jgi:penicillin-binding protein 2
MPDSRPVLRGDYKGTPLQSCTPVSPRFTMNHSLLRQRLILFQAIVVLAFVLLAVQLWRIQILEGSAYQLQSRENSVGFEIIDAPRGVIYDRDGSILVRNRPTFRATLVPAIVFNETYLLWTPEEDEAVAQSLRQIALALRMPFPYVTPGESLRSAFQNATGRMLLEDVSKLCQDGQLLECFAEALVMAPYDTLTIQRDIPQDVAFTAMENSINLPGLTLVAESQREYLYGDLYAHLLGYEVPITQEQLDTQTRFTTNPYLSTDRIGAAGIEAGFEDELRGLKGIRRLEENVVGRKIRVLQEDPATPGHNLFLTIDTGLQQAVQEALAEGLAGVNSQEGVAIVMRPKTGEILAMVSLPTYDNNVFASEVDPEQFRALNEDPLKPLFNRAISGQYPPGSIYKIIPATAALAEGVITRDTAIHDPGVISIPNENAPDDPTLAQDFVCWLRSGHGDETVVDALAHSCDVFFYEIAGGYLDQFRGLGIDRLADWSMNFGLGELTGIDLPGEAAGRVPTRQWKRLYQQQSWLVGDTYNMSIGQGFMLVTPLQILNATTAIANRGTIYEPQIVYQIQSADGQVIRGFEPQVLRTLPVDGVYLDMVAEGMRGAIAWEDGTARFPFEGAPVSVAGKTGTAEYCPVIQKPDGTFDCKLDADGNQLTHAWFTAYAPYEDPEIALVVFVHGNNEDVIQGSEVAAPIGRRIVDYYFGNHPLDPNAPVLPTPQPGSGATATPFMVASPTPILTQPAATPMATPTSPKAEEPLQLPTATRAANGQYTSTLIRTDEQGGELSIVSGRVVDANGNPVSGVTITLDGGGAPVATLTTAGDGSFRYDLLNAAQASTWYVRAPTLSGTPFMVLSVEPYRHYIVLFQGE